MKKLLILFFSLIVFSFSFSEADYLKGVDAEKIKNILINDGFKFEEVETSYFFQKRNGKFEQRVDFYFVDEGLYQLEVVSCHFHTKPEESTIKNELDRITQKIIAGIDNKPLKDEMIKALNKMPANSPEVRPGKMDDLEKLYKYYEVGDYSVDTVNGKNEKSIKISCD